MYKRGISPLITIILILGLTIALAAVVMVWGGDIIRGMQKGSDEVALKQIACGDVILDIKSVSLLGDKLKLFIENSGTKAIANFTIRIQGSNGGDVVQTSGPGLPVFDIQNFEVTFDPSKVGNIKKIEVLPIIIQDGKPSVCNNNYDTEEFNIGNNPESESGWYMKVGENTGMGIDLCGWNCSSWANPPLDTSWFQGNYNAPVIYNIVPPPVATYTIDNELLGWWYFDGTAWNSLPLGPNFSDWRSSDSYTLPTTALNQYRIIWQLRNFNTSHYGNPGGFLAQLTSPKDILLSSSIWEVSFIKENLTTPDLDSLIWTSSTEYGANGDPLILWNSTNGGPVKDISADAKWIWTAANFENPESPGNNDSVFIKTLYDPPPNQCPPSPDEGYMVCCSCDDPNGDCTSCQITVWFNKYLQVPANVTKVWLRYSYDDEVKIYVNGVERLYNPCCVNPIDLDLTSYIVKGSQNLIAIKLREKCSCGYFGGKVWYEY